MKHKERMDGYGIQESPWTDQGEGQLSHGKPLTTRLGVEKVFESRKKEKAT